MLILRRVKRITESKDNIRTSIVKAMQPDVWVHQQLGNYDFYYNKNNSNLVIVYSYRGETSIAQVGEGDINWTNLRSRDDVNDYFANSESVWLRDVEI